MGNYQGVKRSDPLLTVGEVAPVAREVLEKHFPGIFEVTAWNTDGEPGLEVRLKGSQSKEPFLVWWDQTEDGVEKDPDRGFIGGRHSHNGVFGNWIQALLTNEVALNLGALVYDEGVGEWMPKPNLYPTFSDYISHLMPWEKNPTIKWVSQKLALWGMRPLVPEPLFPWFDDPSYKVTP